MKTQKILGLLLALFLVQSCSKKSVADFDSDFSLFKDHITGFTSGYVSVSSDIRVQLAFTKSDWQPKQELDSDFFEISPSVSGKVVALSNNTLAFVPKEKLEQNTLYQVTLRLSKIKEVPKELADFNFSFRTIKQDFIVTTQDLQSYSKDLYYLNGTLKMADQLNFEDAQKIILANQGGKKLKIVFDKATSTSTEFKFMIDSIQRYTDDSQIELLWDGEDLDIEQSGGTTLLIPGKNQFKVVDIKIGDENNESIEINFSDPLRKDQDFSGLVAVENTDNLKFATMGNVLKVFFDKKPESKIDQGEVASAVVDTAAAIADTTAVYTEPVTVEEETSSETGFSGIKRIEIFQGIESSDGYKMKANYSESLTFESIKPGVKLLKNGTILPSSSNLKINFQAANLNAVDVKIYKIYQNNILQFLQDNELNGTQNLRRVSQPIAKGTIPLQQNNLIDYSKWNVYALDIAQFVKPEPGAIYRVEFSYKKKYSLYKCGTTASDENQNQEENEELPEDDVNYSNSGYDYYYEQDYEWRESQDPCSDYYFYNTRIGTNILASDLGVIVKRGTDKSINVAVSNLIDTNPVSGATIELYNYQQQKIAEAKSNGDGWATFALNKYAYFALVTDGKSSTYVKLDDELSLSVSNFEVAGATLEKGLKGYIYGERGVWRPGDTLFVSFILNDKANPIPKNHPVKFRLNDPNGKTQFQSVQTVNDWNHYKFVVPTTSTALTGNWEAMVSVGGARFYKSIKIETIKPNRLKIKNSFNEPLLSAGKINTNTIQVLWLHGAVAKNLKLDVQAKLTKQTTTFKGYQNFVFDDPTREFYTEEFSVFSGKIGEDGKAKVTINPSLEGQAPGMLKAAFITKVYENGGDFSTDVSTVSYSPYATYVGVKAPQPNKYGLLETGRGNTFEIVSVSENGKPKSVPNLEVSVYRMESRWWWDESEDNLSGYTTSNATTTYKFFRVATNASGKAKIQFSAPDEDWGKYLIRVYDPNGGHAAAKTVFLDYPYWSAKSRNTNGEEASMLRFSTDKEKYQVGETAKIFFPSSEGGRALVSIENGTKVLKTLWVKTKKTETQLELPITGDMAPNIYVNVTLLQPHASTQNDAPIRMYGIVGLEVINQATVIEPVLVMPEVIRPEQKTTLQVREKKGKAMTYTIAVVDDGLLDLTRFQTPNAWNDFYQREALGVRTWDIYDQVIGAYGGKVNQVFSIGGDASLGGGKAKKANRFKPVVLYFGPYKLEKGKTRSHTIKLPKYIGSVRTMIVAADAETAAYGSTEKTTTVKSPLMLLASLPRKITPSEKVTLPVTLFATEKNIKKVSLQIKTNGLVKVAGKPSQIVSFTQPDEKMAYFDLEVGQATGICNIQIIATSGKEKSVYNVEVDVTNPNPVTHAFTDYVLQPNQTKSINWKTFGVAGSNKAIVEISSVPTIDFGRRLNYLIQYPHGCVEQTTSSVFPQLYVSEVLDLDSSRKQSIQRNVTAGIQRLGNFQLPNGGFSYWPGLSDADDWGTSYAGHFLIEAEKKGYVVPVNFKTKWLAFQQREAKQWRFEKSYRNDEAQSYRLYTLALAGAPDMASMNRLRETNGISNESRLRLAATYALIKQNRAGLSLLSKSVIDENTASYYYWYGSADRNRAMALETLLLVGQKQKAFQMATRLAKSLSSDTWMSTQTTAYGLYAMAKFAKSNGGKGVTVQLLQGKATQVINSNKAIVQRQLTVQTGSNSIVLKNTKNNTLFVRVLNSGILPIGKEQPMANNLTASVQFTDRKGKMLSLAKIAQGTECIAEVVVTNQKNEKVENIALTQLVPSGFEIVNTRFTDFGNATENNADYIDIRDDRANYYFSLKPYETRRFKMIWNASYLGKYYLPGMQCEAMYDHSFMARTAGQWVTIVK